MVYLKSWSEYEAAATDLYKEAPNKVRYCVKFRPKEGKLVLKVTDDIKCIKYKTHSSIILNRFETLNLRLLTLMAAPSTSSSSIPDQPTPLPAAVEAVAGGGRAAVGKGEKDADGDVMMGVENGPGDPKGKPSAVTGPGGAAAGKKKKKGKK